MRVEFAGAAAVKGGRHGRVTQALAHCDYWRRSPSRFGGLGGHKEWMHFCVHADGVDFLVNFSMVDDTRSVAMPGTEFGRLTVLVRDHTSTWDGDVERFPSDEIELRGGGLDITLGPNQLRWSDGRYRLQVSLRQRPVAIELELEPQCLPALSNNIRLDLGTPINWLVLPRLRARGRATIGAHTYTFDDAPAYHDHNWGHFDWGRDFAWEWCYALPLDSANPWSLVFVRLDNLSRTRTYMQGLFLWHGSRPRRIFRSHDIRVRQEGFIPPHPLLKIPRPMGLICPGTATDVPARVEVTARGEGDAVDVEFESEDLAQVIIPNDTDVRGVTIINEVSGHLRVNGVVGSQPVSMSGPAIFEFIRD